MSYIFLDIDQTLNSHHFFGRRQAECGVDADRESPLSKAKLSELNGLSYEAQDIDPLCVARLNRVIAATGAVVVISSIWKIQFDPKQMESILMERGFVGQVIDRTPTNHNRRRWPEIKLWLEMNKMRKSQWIAIDDEHLNLEGCPRYRLVLTTADYGFTDDLAEEATAKLKGEFK